MTAQLKRLKIAGVAMIAGLMAASPMMAGGVTIGINARARTICKVEVGAVMLPTFQAGENALGRMTELCNNVDGYRLILLHPAGLEDAFAVVDGVRVPISAAATQTVIVDSTHAAFRERDLGIVLSSTEGNLNLALRAEAKGMIF